VYVGNYYMSHVCDSIKGLKYSAIENSLPQDIVTHLAGKYNSYFVVIHV
jgi:hypothetical protein